MCTTTIGDPDQIVLVSEWRDRAAMEVHYRSDTFACFQRRIDALLVRESEMTLYDGVSAVRPVSSGPISPRDAD